MSTAISTLLQLAISLLMAVQSSPSLSVAQQQQAISVATQAVQIAAQELQGSSAEPSGAIAVDAGLPMRLVIPKLDINAAFQYDGLASSGVMETPSNVSDVGWFTGSALPGKSGVAIVIGHVAQIRRGVVTKQGVFSSLGLLHAGDTFSVINHEGSITVFMVRKSRVYDPAADATEVFSSSDGGAHLNLITCEGTWNQAQLEYTQRLVVFADMVE